MGKNDTSTRIGCLPVDSIASVVFADKVPQVAIALPPNAKIPRDMRKGILRYAKECGPWMMHLLEGREFSPRISDLRATDLTGFIGYVTTDEDAKSIMRLKVPCVLRWLDSGKLPPRVEKLMRTSATISTDSAAIGRMAAKYYLSSRYRNFAYVGEPDESIGWSQIREKAFAATLADAGRRCSAFRSPGARSLAAEMPALVEWLKSLPKPVGVFAVHDERARQVADACMAAGLSVPSEVGILGCDNDEDLCESFYPAISSIAVDAERAAYLAAKMLDGCMRGVFAPHRIVYGPVRVVERRSTMLRGGRFDPVVEKALKLIEVNVTNGIRIDGLCASLGMSRRQLERRFLLAGRNSLLCEINAAKLERACVLLESEQLRLKDISAMLGFSSTSHFCKIYRERYGCTPRDRRR